MITKILNFIRDDSYKLPKDRFANQEEIEEYIRQDIGLNDFKLIDSNEGKHEWFYKENNERGVIFEIFQKQSYDSLFGTGYHYPAFDNYDELILERYIQKNQLPDEDYFTRQNVENLHSASDMDFNNGKIVAVYTDDNVNNVVTNLYNYLSEFYKYNNNLTGINRELKIKVIFQKKNTEEFTRVEIGSSKKDKLSNFIKKSLEKIDNVRNK